MDTTALEYPTRTSRQRAPYLLAGAGLALLAAAAWLTWSPSQRPPLSGALESTPWGWRLRFAVEADRLDQVRRYGRARVLPENMPRANGRIDRLAGVWNGGRLIEVTARFLPDEPLNGPSFGPATVVLERP